MLRCCALGQQMTGPRRTATTNSGRTGPQYWPATSIYALLEVVANALTHSLTDPRQVYVLRWIAGRHAGVPNFDPPYTLE